jgi:hypothetical protein
MTLMPSSKPSPTGKSLAQLKTASSPFRGHGLSDERSDLGIGTGLAIIGFGEW